MVGMGMCIMVAIRRREFRLACFAASSLMIRYAIHVMKRATHVMKT
jgi:hypothetical protein